MGYMKIFLAPKGIQMAIINDSLKRHLMKLLSNFIVCHITLCSEVIFIMLSHIPLCVFYISFKLSEVCAIWSIIQFRSEGHDAHFKRKQVNSIKTLVWLFERAGFLKFHYEGQAMKDLQEKLSCKIWPLSSTFYV